MKKLWHQTHLRLVVGEVLWRRLVARGRGRGPVGAARAVQGLVLSLAVHALGVVVVVDAARDRHVQVEVKVLGS